MQPESVTARSALTPAPASRALERAGNRLALAERIAHLGSWALELPGRQLLHSSEFAAILGLAPDIPVTLDELVSRFMPECRDSISSLLRNCSQDGTPFDEEMQIETTMRDRKWVRAVGEAVRNKRGRITGLQGVLQDISAQKQAQHETLFLAMHLTTTLASITEAFATLDRQCCFTYLNQESEQLLRHTTRELLGKEVWQVLINNQGQGLRQQLQRCIATHRRVEFEDFYPGVGKWLEVRAYPFAEGLAVYFRDVTTRRKSQEQLMLLETCISRLNDIVLIAEALPTSEQVPYTVFVNQAFELHTGYSRHEVLGQTPGKLLCPGTTPDELQQMARILLKKSRARSELLIYRKDGSCFWLELEIVRVVAPEGELTHWVAVGRDVTQRKASADAIHQLAFYDPLTSLPNRLLLLNRLEHVLAQKAHTRRQGALMFIDVDKLKVLNDTLGHHKGDLLLQQVAERLSSCVEATDTVARLGGDEFVVMLENLGAHDVDTDSADSTEQGVSAFQTLGQQASPSVLYAEDKARAVGQKIVAALAEPFDLAGHQHHCTCSVGITMFGKQPVTLSDVLKQADLAMYQAKDEGRNGLCFFDPAMQALAVSNAALNSDLRRGLRDGEFELYYQPQVGRGGRMFGVEALLRWQHPERGLVTPDLFIPQAEESGLIMPLGEWALRAACQQLAIWGERPETAYLSIAVNVSMRQFRHPEFVDQVLAMIADTGIRANRLKLELTESLLATGLEVTIAKMGRLKALGVTLSIDDFGMGYSALSYLKYLPLDQLKIDRAFVKDVLTDPNDAAIARTIIGLAQSLGLSVVAEGVETDEQRAFLAKHGCDCYQGWLFCKALPIDKLEEFMKVIWHAELLV